MTIKESKGIAAQDRSHLVIDVPLNCSHGHVNIVDATAIIYKVDLNMVFFPKKVVNSRRPLKL